MAPEEQSFMWSEVRRGVMSLQLWLSASAYFAILSGLYSFGLFVRHPILTMKSKALTESSYRLSSRTLDLPKMPTKFSFGRLFLTR